MADILQTSLSALLASQRALATTGHNVANANTPGYSRQRVDLLSRAPTGSAGLAIGNGVRAASVSRSYDGFQAAELRLNQSAVSRLQSFQNIASRISGLLADENAGLSPSMQGFFSAAQDVANDPASLPARQAFVSQIDAVSERFRTLSGQFDSMEREISGRLRQEVDEIDSLARSIADINQEIIARSGASGGQPPNDLLDRRDVMLDQLSEKVTVNTFVQEDGALNVFIGSGQSLVVGGQASSIEVRTDAFDENRVTIVLENGASEVDISAALTGGSVGGLLDVRREMLDSARNQVGRIAIAFATTVNEQHAQGMDLNGNLGGDLFTVASPAVLDASDNAGTGSVSAAVADVSQLEAADYVLSFDGSNYALSRADTGQPIPMTGSGTGADPFVANGVSIVTSGAPVAGDRFLIRPVYEGAAQLGRAVSAPQDVAAAAPVRSSADAGNAGDATISAGEVIDATDPGLLSSSVIEFTGPGTYSINGAGSFAYTPGDPIDVNGARFVIDGTPVAGDRFTIEANTGGLGDNRNMLEIGDIQSFGVLDGGTSSVSSAVGQIVAEVGTMTRYADTNLEAQGLLLEQSIAQRESVSGVNLDEEAANMLRFQQSYQAAAQMITVADTLFRSLLNAVGR